MEIEGGGVMINELTIPQKYYQDKHGVKCEVLYWNWNYIWFRRESSGRLSRKKWSHFRREMSLAA